MFVIAKKEVIELKLFEMSQIGPLKVQNSDEEKEIILEIARRKELSNPVKYWKESKKVKVQRKDQIRIERIANRKNKTILAFE